MAITKEDAKKLWGEVRSNIDRLDACPKHKFGGNIIFGGKLGCEHCGGAMNNTDAISYARGFAAAGGDPTEIHPGFDFIKSAAPATTADGRGE